MEPEPPRAAAAGPRILVALATRGRTESSVSLASSLVTLQSACRARGAEMTFTAVHDANDALNLLIGRWHRGPAPERGRFDACVVVDPGVSFDPAFVFDALASPHGVVLGVYPANHEVDWAKVDAHHAAASSVAEKKLETLEHCANEYNVDVSAGADWRARYVPADAGDLGAAVVKRSTVEAVEAAFPSLLAPDGVWGFAKEGPLPPAGGREGGPCADGLVTYYPSGDDKFCAAVRRACGADAVAADLGLPCVRFGPMRFEGCMARRCRAVGGETPEPLA